MTNKFLIIFFLNIPLFGLGLAISEKREIPNTKEGKNIEQFLEIFNNRDITSYEKFVENHFTDGLKEHLSYEGVLAFFNSRTTLYGNLLFHSIRKNENDSESLYRVIVKNQNLNNWTEVQFYYTSNENLKIDHLSLNATSPPNGILYNNRSEQELVKITTNVLNEFSENNLFSGTVLIAKRDSILYQKAFGEASKRYHVPNNIATKLNLCSTGKMFTGVSIIQLHEKGLLNLQDPIGKYIDTSWILKEFSDKITIHHLLCHQSGLGNFFNDDFFNGSKELFRNVNDFKMLVQGDTLLFEPGTKFGYSNIGMLLLGVIIEEVSGLSYFDYVDKYIYGPLNMDNSGCFNMDEPVENLAIGYTPNNDESGWKNNYYWHVIKGGPAGGGFSNVYDLHKFGLAILNEELVSKESWGLLLSNHTDINNVWGYSYYGYGFLLTEINNNSVVGHVGGFPGYSAGFNVFPKNGYIICVLSNYYPIGSDICMELTNLFSELSD